MNAFLLLLSVAFTSTAYASYYDEEPELIYKNHHRGPPEHTHLVTMRKNEFLDILDCVSDAIAEKDVKTCRQFARCEDMMAPQVIRANRKCRMSITGVDRTICIPGKPLFPNREVPSRIFDCTNAKTDEETPEERLDMVKFEQCSRKVSDRACRYRSSLHDFHDMLYDYDRK